MYEYAWLYDDIHGVCVSMYVVYRGVCMNIRGVCMGYVGVCLGCVDVCMGMHVHVRVCRCTYEVYVSSCEAYMIIYEHA